MIEVREVPESRFDSLVPLLNAFKQEIGEAPLDERDEHGIREALCQGRISFFVAQDGERAVGICSLSMAFSTYAGGKRLGVFDDFYVVPDRRKQGIATLLTQRAFAGARSSGCSSVIVGSSRGDVPMYEHLGFTVRLGYMLAKDLVAELLEDSKHAD